MYVWYLVPVLVGARWVAATSEVCVIASMVLLCTRWYTSSVPLAPAILSHVVRTRMLHSSKPGNCPSHDSCILRQRAQIIARSCMGRFGQQQLLAYANPWVGVGMDMYATGCRGGWLGPTGQPAGHVVEKPGAWGICGNGRTPCQCAWDLLFDPWNRCRHMTWALRGPAKMAQSQAKPLQKQVPRC